MSEDDAIYQEARQDFLTGRPVPVPLDGVHAAGYLDALADTVRDLATAVRLLTGDEHNENVDVVALRERLAQIRPRGE